MDSDCICTFVGDVLTTLQSALSKGGRPGVFQPNAVDSGLRSEKKRLPIRIAPSHIVRVLRATQRAEVVAFRRKNPQPARPADENISSLIHLDAVNCVLARRPGHVEKHSAFAEGAIIINRVTV